MAETRKRSVSTRTASRRRDRVNEEAEEEDEEDVDATPPRTASKSTTRRRRPAAVEEDEEETEDDEDEEEPPPVRKKKRAAPPPEEDEEDEPDDEDEEEEKPAPKRRTKPKPAPAEDDDDEEEKPRPSRRSSSSASKSKLPPGVRRGATGAAATAKAGGAGEGRITLDKTPILVKVLDTADTILTYRQHWLSQGKGQGDRAFVCIGKPECPVCKYADRTSFTAAINVLNLSAEGKPKNAYLQIGKRAYDSLMEQSQTSEGVSKPNLGFWSVNKTGKDTSSQTNVRPVKQRDIVDDWAEVLDGFDLPEDFTEEEFTALLKEEIAEAKKHLFAPGEIVQTHTKKQLADASKYLADDEDGDEEDEDED